MKGIVFTKIIEPSAFRLIKDSRGTLWAIATTVPTLPWPSPLGLRNLIVVPRFR